MTGFDLPFTFRSEITPHLFQAIRRSWSCALVGMRGVGMSNLLRFICEPRVVAHYLEPEHAKTLLVYLDIDPSSDALHVIHTIADRILRAAVAFKWRKADRFALYSLSSEPAAHNDLAHAESMLAQINAFVCNSKGWQMVWVFDGFDAAFVDLPGDSLRMLRRMRDDHKQMLCYVIGTRKELAQLSDRRVDPLVEKFAELFDLHSYALKPYSDEDALTLLTRKSLGWDQALTPEQTRWLYRVSGGHAQLLVAAMLHLDTRRHLPLPDVERSMLHNPLFDDICRKLWDDLDPVEQAVLNDVANNRGSTLPPASLASLRMMGLLIGGPDSIFSTLFEAYVKRMDAPSIETLSLSASHRLQRSKLQDPNATSDC